MCPKTLSVSVCSRHKSQHSRQYAGGVYWENTHLIRDSREVFLGIIYLTSDPDSMARRDRVKATYLFRFRRAPLALDLFQRRLRCPLA